MIKKITYCKQITFSKYGKKPSIIFGLITKQDDYFLTIQTGKKQHIIATKTVLAIEDTDSEFVGDSK